MSSSIPVINENMKITTGPNWLDLPRDVTANILQRLGTIEILTNACQVRSLWWNICKDPRMWRTINITKYGYKHSMRNKDKFVKICRNAIERSCGQVEDIDIERCRENVMDFRPPSLHCYSSRYYYGWGIESENWSGYED